MMQPASGGGSVLVASNAPQQVRVLWARGCLTIATFAAARDARYLVRIDEDGTATVEQTKSVALGPGVTPLQASPCA